VTKLLDDVGLSNALIRSPDGATFYYIDSFTRSAMRLISTLVGHHRGRRR